MQNSSILPDELPSSIRFERISATEGLSSNAVRIIYQDRVGYIWIGTQDGLNRFDGYQYKIFRHDPFDPETLRDNFIETIYEDHTGTLWIGTQSGWLEKFDPETNSFSHFHLGSRILSIYEDSRENLWVGTFEPGLFVFDRETETTNLILSGGNFNSILEDTYGNLWVANSDQGLIVINTVTFEARQISTDYPINQLIVGHDANIWLGTNGGGLGYLDTSTEIIKYYSLNSEKQDSGADWISTLHMDEVDRLWVGTWDKGLIVYTLETDTFSNFQNDSLNSNSLSNNTVVSILVDRSGVLWVGNEFGGINKASLNTFDFGYIQHRAGASNSLAEGIVTSIHEDQEGNLWVGTLGGLSLWNRGEDSWTNYYTADDKQLAVRSLYLDKDNQLWVGTENGLFLYNRESDQLSHFDTPVVMWMLEDSDGIFWLATKGGLYQLDPESGEIDFIFKGISWKIFVYEDSSGNIWVGSSGDGVDVKDFKTDEWRHYEHDPENENSLSGNFIETIQQDSSGKLWIGTNNGFNLYNPETKTFSHYFVSDGLPHNYVVGILEDSQKNLWISTLGGLSKFDPLEKSFENYYQSDGLQGNWFWRNSYHQTENNELIFGGVNGFNIFNPDTIEKNPYIPPVVITSISLFNKPAFLNISNGDIVELSYKENFLSFDFASLDYTDPAQNEFAYQMEGVDSDWVEIGNRAHVDYPNLDPGEYTFLVKGSNNDGVWNDQGAWVQISITPPFWRTTWFTSLMIFAIIGIGYGAFRYRIRRLQERSLQLEIEVAQRTTELQTANQQLEEEIAGRERVEMILTEKAAEDAVAEERTRLARELHDAVTQTLFSASLLAEALPNSWENEPEEGRQLLTEIRQLSRGALAEMRTLLHELRPTTIVETVMWELLRQLGEAVTGREGIPVSVEVDCKCNLPADVHVALYRIAQESLNNIVKHARASKVTIQLNCTKCTSNIDEPITAQKVILTISDNGKGFDVQEHIEEGMGLGIMRERAELINAKFQITSQLGQGTQINVIWDETENEND